MKKNFQGTCVPAKSKTMKINVLEQNVDIKSNEMQGNESECQLAAQEEKQNKNKKKGQLNGDGLPRLLAGDKFYNHVIHLWKEENELAKQEERRIGWAKPKLGKLEPAAPKPGAEQGECSNAGERNGDVTDNKMSKATAYMMILLSLQHAFLVVAQVVEVVQ
ncbi:hypothetical protein V8E55_007190 [Tylopilus felleus]